MRTLIDIPDAQIKALARVCKAEKRSRAAVVRDAIGIYLESRRRNRGNDAIEAAFGLWKDRNIDSLEYQRKLRDEW